MNLKYLERGTKLKIFEEYDMRAVSEEYDAVFKYFETETLFIIFSPEIYENYDKLNADAILNISFMTDFNIYIFTGRAVEKQRTSGMILVEQLAEIVTINRRKYTRDEMRVRVRAYGLSEKKLESTYFDLPDAVPELVDMTYDISVGGVCVISNTLLTCKYDPYYLIDFTLTANDKDAFVLPSKLVRRSNYPRTKIGRYDYGFQFIFDNLPDERGRLSRAILSRKLSLR